MGAAGEEKTGRRYGLRSSENSALRELSGAAGSGEDERAVRLMCGLLKEECSHEQIPSSIIPSVARGPQLRCPKPHCMIALEWAGSGTIV